MSDHSISVADWLDLNGLSCYEDELLASGAETLADLVLVESALNALRRRQNGRRKTSPFYFAGLSEGRSGLPVTTEVAGGPAAHRGLP